MGQNVVRMFRAAVVLDTEHKILKEEEKIWNINIRNYEDRGGLRETKQTLNYCINLRGSIEEKYCYINLG